MFFRRALAIEPADGELWGRFANFQWLGQRNHSEAERAFQAAIALEPTSAHCSVGQCRLTL